MKNSYRLWADGAGFVNSEEALKRLNAFSEEVQALRIKHKIPNILVIARCYVKEDEGEGWGCKTVTDGAGDTVQLKDMAEDFIGTLKRPGGNPLAALLGM